MKFSRIAYLVFALFVLSASALHADSKKLRIAVIDTTFKVRNASAVINDNIITNLSRQQEFKIVFTTGNEAFRPQYLKNKKEIINYGININVDIIVTINLRKTDKYFLNTRIFDIKKQRLIASPRFELDKLNSKELDKISNQISSYTLNRVTVYTQKSRNNLLLRPVFAGAISFKNRTKYGGGGSLLYIAEDYFYDNSIFGAEVQYLYMASHTFKYSHGLIAPLFLRTGYNFLHGDFSLFPSMSLGGAYSAFYFYKNRDTTQTEKSSTVSPAFKFSLDLLLILEHSYLNAGVDYNFISDKDKNLTYITCSLGFSINF